MAYTPAWAAGGSDADGQPWNQPPRSQSDCEAIIATFGSEPRVEHIGIHEIKDLRPDRPAIGDAPNYHLGLARVDRTRKLAFATVDLLTDLLDGGQIAVALQDATIEHSGPVGELHHRIFLRSDGDRILILWNRTAADAVQVHLSPPWRSITEFGLDGSATNVEGSHDPLRVTLRAGLPRIFRVHAR